MAAQESAGVKVPPPVIFTTGLVLGLVLDGALDGGPIPSALRWVLGIALVAGGLALQASFIALFRRAGTHVEPWKPTSAIVTDGPYRFTRNPAYVGMALIVAGVAVLADAPWALLVIPIVVGVIDRYVIAREERYLERSFGEEYLAYKRRVRRWV